jgi:hypothetical protein
VLGCRAFALGFLETGGAALTLDTSRTSWTARAESSIKRLRDVDAASVKMDGDEVREIHVITGSHRQAKHIVRDVVTVMETEMQTAIDYRVVSIAYVDREKDDRSSGSDGMSRPRPPLPVEERDFEREDPAPGFRHAPADRIRFGSVNLFVSGPRTQAQVELRWKGLARMGSAAGWSTRDGAHRLVAQATLAAVQEYLDGEMAFSVQDVDFIRLGRKRVALVALSLLAHRQERSLIGSCSVEQDAQQAVVLATLAALNRVVGGLPTREPTEYVLRPTST